MSNSVRAAFAFVVVSVPFSATFAAPLECITTPNRLMDVAFGTSGVVSHVAVERGASVTPGQLLAKLDSSLEDAAIAIAKAKLAERAALEAARAQLQIAEKQAERARGLIAQQATTAVRVEETETGRIAAMRSVREQEELKLIQALEVQRLQAALSQRKLFSPVEGVIVDIHVQAAEFVDARKAMTVAQIDPIAIDVIAPASLFGAVRTGQSIPVSLGMPAGMQIEARIELLDAYVDGASGTFRVRLRAPNPDRMIVAGFPCRAHFPEAPIR